MKRILLTGMSGTGKSTVVGELAARGYRAIDEVLLRPSRREDATAYRDLRLDALQRSPAAFGADYESSAVRPLSFWEERMAQGMIGEQGVTYLALAGDALIGMTSLVRNTLAKTQHSAAIFGVYLARSGLRLSSVVCRRNWQRTFRKLYWRRAGGPAVAEPAKEQLLHNCLSAVPYASA